MKWFKHDSNASTDAKLRKLKMKYGMEGYGVYWQCLELVAMNVDTHNLTFELEHDGELIAYETGIHIERVNELMAYMINLGLFESSANKVFCLKMATRTDEYTQKIIKKQGITVISGECPDSVPTTSGLREEKRIEENRREERESTETQSTSVDSPPLNSAKPKKPTTKGTRIAKDWYLTDELRAWTKTTLAESNITTMNIDVEEQKFFDHWISVPGAKATKVDWAATWRSWIRRGAGL